MAMMQSDYLQSAVDDLTARGVKTIVLVPNGTTTEYNSLTRQWKYIFGMENQEATYLEVPKVNSDARFVMTSHFADHPLITEILYENAKEVSKNPAKEVVIIVGHGPEDIEDNGPDLKILQPHVDRLKAKNEFADVKMINLQDDAIPPVRESNVRKLRRWVKQADQKGMTPIVVAIAAASFGVQTHIRTDLRGLDYVFADKGMAENPKYIQWITSVIEGHHRRAAKGRRKSLAPNACLRSLMSDTEIPVPVLYAALAGRGARRTATDAVRRLDELLTYVGVRPGWQVADLMASRGYVAAALAALVGDTGKVYAHNSPALLARFKGDNPIDARIRDQGIRNLFSLVAELEAPGLPVGQLDAVFSVMFYHDTVWVGTDRSAMNKAVFAALKPGGIYAVVDHHAPPGTGIGHARDLHRIDRETVTAEVAAAGFELADQSDFLENPDDPLTVMCPQTGAT